MLLYLPYGIFQEFDLSFWIFPFLISEPRNQIVQMMKIKQGYFSQRNIQQVSLIHLLSWAVINNSLLMGS